MTNKEQLLERYASLRTKVAELFSPTTQTLVDEALVYADAHIGELRRYDGTPLLDHDVEVAYIVVSEIGLGRNSAVASILHDTVRLAAKADDGTLAPMLDEIAEKFGKE
ncbi:MAG: HD domain-containing protein, partial [Alistipes sp.]